ncbi:MAG: hypothetical protein E7157_02490 [Lactobacillales bacterium]|nr:hypothetical protein [Lactobacillales bacterium]
MKIGELEINKLSTKVNKKNIFIGNIKRCTKYREVDINGQPSYVVYNSEIYAENVILVKVSDNPVGYINLRSFESLLDYLKQNNIKNYEGTSLEDSILYTHVNGLGSIWVDKVKPYYKKELGHVKVSKIEKKEKVKVKIDKIIKK